MRRRRRVRRVAKWTGLVVCSLVAGCWAVNLRWNIMINFGGSAAGFGQGSIGVNLDWDAQPRISITECRRYQWTPHVVPAASFFFFPFWLVLSVFVPVTGILWWRDRRRPEPGHCRCGYNLTGNVSGRCPECGAAVRRARN